MDKFTTAILYVLMTALAIFAVSFLLSLTAVFAAFAFQVWTMS